MNRVPMFILRRDFRRDLQCARPLEGLRIVDVGCGGGILSEVFLDLVLFSTQIWDSCSSKYLEKDLSFLLMNVDFVVSI